MHLRPRTYSILIYLLFACVALVETPQLFHGTLSCDERFVEYIPWRAEAARIVHTGEFPFYTDRLGGGMPLMSTAYVGVYYPLNAVYLLLRPIDAANVLAALHAFLALAGMFVYLRSRRVSRLAAFAGALVFGTNTFLISHSAHVSMDEAACLAPWVAWAARRLALRPTPRRTAFLAAAFVLQMAVGYLQIVLITLGWVAVEWLVSGGMRLRRFRSGGAGRNGGRRAMLFPRRFFRFTLGLLVAGGVAVSIMAVQILPTLKHLKETPRVLMTLAEWEDASFNPTNSLIFFNPRSDTRIEEQWMTLCAAGIALFAASLALFLFFRRRFRPESRAFLWVAFPAMLLVFVFALGSHFPPNAVLFHVMPFNLFRVPPRWLLLAIALATCAGAMGLDALRTLLPRTRGMIFVGAWIAWGLLLTAVHWAALHSGTMIPSYPPRSLSQLLFTTHGGVLWQYAAVGLAGVAVCLPRRFPTVVAGALFLAAILADYDFPVPGVILEPANCNRVTTFEKLPLFHGVRRSDIVRYFTLEQSEQVATANLGVFLGVPNLMVYCPLASQRLLETFKEGRDGEWRAFGLYRNAAPLELLAVTHATFPEKEIAPAPGVPTPPGSPYEILNVIEDRNRRVALVRLRHPLPRFDFAPMWAETHSFEETDRRVWAKTPAVEDRPVLIESPHYRYFPPPVKPLPRGTITVLDNHAAYKRLRVDTPGPAIVLIRDMWWPGWRYWIESASGGTLDGVHGVYRAQGLIQAVPVPGGTVTVDLQYRPPDWRTAVAISIFGLLCLVLLVVGKLPALSRR